MRYAVISDVHANRQALKAVLTDISSNDIDKIISLGDLVGYGPSPAEVLETAYSNIHHFVLGNHDAVIAGKIVPSYFNEDARKIIEWTASNLGKGAGTFFRKIPLVLKGADFRATHGEFSDPGSFEYIFDEKDALKSFGACSEALLFTGHSHIPGIFVVGQSGKAHWLDPRDFQIEEGKRYIVNAGSVGQPRNGDVRASYCIYDSELSDVLFRQVPFDIDAFREDLDRNSIPEKASYFLGARKERLSGPLRDIVGFRPLSPGDRVSTKQDIQDLEETVSRLKKSKNIMLLCIAGLLAACICLGVILFFRGSGTSATEYPALSSSPLVQSFVNSQLVQMPSFRGEVSGQQRLEEWSVILQEPRTQAVNVAEEGSETDSETVFRLDSKNGRIELISRPVKARKGMRFTANAQFKLRNPDTEIQFIEIALLESMPDGAKRTIVNREPKNLDHERWTRTSITMPTDQAFRENTVIQFAVRANFAGGILVRKCDFRRK